MTSMPDAAAIGGAPPPRPASAQPRGGGPSEDDGRDGGFASLVDEAAAEPGGPARPDQLRKRKEPKTDSPAAAQGAIVQAVLQTAVPTAQAGGGMEGVKTPTADPAAVQAGNAAAPAIAGPAAPEAGQPAGGNAGQAATPATPATPAIPAFPATPSSPAIPTATPGTASPPASAIVPQPASGPEAPHAGSERTGASHAAPTDPTPQGDAGQPIIATTAGQPGQAPPPSVPPTVPPSLAASPAAPAPSDATAEVVPDRREARQQDGDGTDPRTALRGARGAARQTGDAGKAEPTAGAIPKAGPPATDPTPVPAGRDPAPPVTASPATGGGDAPATGFEAVPTLPAQAATQYAAAAASGRTATAHSPAMAQLAAPLVRVLESGGGAFHIDLAPAELGRIRVVADVSDGKVSLTVQAEQADTLALLRRDLTRLEQALGDAGLSLDGSSLHFSMQSDGQPGGFAAPDRGGGARGWRVQAETTPEPIADRPMRPIDGLVDVTV
ncbi:flagellar hook-length control protein (plasmid) [Azospirillum sp. B510]|uniref:flagellar hook-length control protein FliK n=1 Tax=Azospirillum sp. (strain B510) TaxID=137722 RepID=UPI0001C4CDAB|nr:flagellar hook-length control protein FliK [Azospirillum sp. B510]BAI76433.1 flagellar hook-length control protein [Azospirillum sp. B510]